MIAENGQTRTRRYRAISYTRPIEAAKEAVSVMELADKLTGSEDIGGLSRRCPLPDHEDRTPSFKLYPETQSFFCFGCLHGGDVVELYRLAHGFDQREAHVAAAHLLHEFGHEPPQRAPTWYRKQERQRRTRDAIDREKVEHIRMLVFRLIWVPWLRDLPEWMRDEAKVSAWESSRNIAKLLYEQRKSA